MGLGLAQCYFLYRLGASNGALQSALNAKDPKLFYRSCREVLQLVFVFAALGAAVDYAQGELRIRWRNVLTKDALKNYLGHAYGVPHRRPSLTIGTDTLPRLASRE